MSLKNNYTVLCIFCESEGNSKCIFKQKIAKVFSKIFHWVAI